MIDAMRGVAACRGSYWATSVARRLGLEHEWPGLGGRCAAIARAKVAELAGDQVELEHLARICYDRAAAEWAALKREPWRIR